MREKKQWKKYFSSNKQNLYRNEIVKITQKRLIFFGNKEKKK